MFSSRAGHFSRNLGCPELAPQPRHNLVELLSPEVCSDTKMTQFHPSSALVLFAIFDIGQYWFTRHFKGFPFR